MKAWKAHWIGSAVALALLVSLLAVTPALAEDTPPPAEPPPVEVVVEEAIVPEGAAPPLEEPATEPPPEAAPAELPTEPVLPAEPPAPALAAPPTDELLAEVPDGTTVAVVGEAGEVLPLASAEAAEVLATGDPVWCPTGVLPPAGAGCSSNYTELEDLVADFVPTGNGVIWILGVVDASGAAVMIDGSVNWVDANAFTLTLQGGWTGTGSGVDASTPSEFHVPLSIVNWNAAVTLNDILITAVPGVNPALDIDTTGKVTLNRVRVEGNGAGARIRNDWPGAASDVAISNSEFNGNTSGHGVAVYSYGTVTLANVIADSNGEDGAYLVNSDAATPKNIVLTSVSFSDNGDDGVSAWSGGALSLKDITAVGNIGQGAYLDNNEDLSVNSPVGLAGVNIFAENGSDGLVVFSKGAITASNLVGNVNGDWGAYLDNSAAPSLLPVTLTGTNEFKFSYGGLYVVAFGAVNISNLTANSSHGSDGLVILNAGDVKITGYLTAESNYRNGVLIESLGTIALANATASDNGWGDSVGVGASLDNRDAPVAKPVTLTGRNFFNGNYSGGLMAYSKGAIAVSSLTANNNEHGDGAYLDNRASTAMLPQKITLTVASTLNENGGYGLEAYSHGAIAIANLTASWNGDYGAILDNYLLGATTKPAPVTLTGKSVFDDNSGGGLDLRSLGAIQVSNLSASWNGATGAYLDNSWPGALGVLTVSGTSEFAGNVGDGLLAYSLGNITLQDWDAYNNDGFGVYLSNAFASSVGNVVAGTSRAHWCNGLSENALSGMEIYSYGAVTLSNLCGGYNGNPSLPSPYGYGLRVDNTGAATPKPVTLKGYTGINNNYSGGVYILSKGAISAANLDAHDNTPGFGAYLDNTSSGAAAPQNVTLTGYNNFRGNEGIGLQVRTYGAVVLTGLDAYGNGQDGISVDNATGAITPKPVTINGFAGASENGGHGISILSLGAVKLANIAADGNLYGVRVDNGSGSAVSPITVTGGLYTGDNINYGLWVTSRGAITFTLSDAWVSENDGDGWILDNTMAASPQPVKLTASAGNNIDFWENGGDGLEVLSKGLISIGTLESNSNDGFGAHLKNNFIGSVGGITLTGPGANFGDNGSYGLLAESLGAITINSPDGLDAGNNSSWGAKLDNSGGSGGVTIGVGGVLGSGFHDNGADGLIVLSKGAITLSDVQASGNGGSGMNADNSASGAGSPQNVVVNKTGGFLPSVLMFTDNDFTGVEVTSYGAITLTSVEASWNGQSGTAGSGASLDNYLGNGITPKPITLNGTNTFNGNNEGGLSVVSIGAIKANNLNANWNGGAGAYLDNQWGQPASAALTLSGANWFEGNGAEGLLVFSHGAITISNLTANWNGDDGAYLDSWSDAGMQKVTLTGTNTFIGNGDEILHEGNGLEVWAGGPITLSNVTANWNAENGAYLDTVDYWRAGTPGIAVSGVNVLTGNHNDGLSFYAVGPVSLSKVTADDNGGDGIDGYSYDSILLSCASLTSNGGYGWYLGSPVSATLKGVFAYGNILGDGLFYDVGDLYIYRSCP